MRKIFIMVLTALFVVISVYGIVACVDKDEDQPLSSVKLEKNMEGAGSVSGTENKKNGKVTISAKTNAGYTFIGWYDGDKKVSDEESYSFSSTADDLVLTATWTYYTLSTEINLPEAGTYTVKSDEKVTEGTEVTLTATQRTGYNFLGWYGYKWCSETSFGLKKDLFSTVKYDDCNPFAMAANEFGEIGKLSKHTTDTAAGTTISAVDSFGKAYDSLMSCFSIPTGGAEFIPDLSGNAKNCYLSFCNNAISVYDNSLVPFTQKMSGNADKGALVGINKKYLITSKTAQGLSFGDYQSAISRLFGYETTSDFLGYADKLISLYKNYNENSALANGCFRTDYGFIFPIAIKNDLTSPVLLYVILDKQSNLSVWVNDIYSTMKATNYKSSVSTSSVIQNRMFCKNTLFINGLSNSSSNLTYKFNMKNSDVLYVATFERCEAHTYDGSGICTKCKEHNHSDSLNANGYCRHGNEFFFGSYPQSRVIDGSKTEKLNATVGSLPTKTNDNSWTSCVNYEKNGESKYMWYIDREYDGEKYRGVYFVEYRPYWCNGEFSSKNSYQDDSGYCVETVHWFKFEPVKWIILDETKIKLNETEKKEKTRLLILADLAIDSRQYYHNDDGSGTGENVIYGNNYKESEIREWLNADFYNAAFNDMQKALIQTTMVDNGAGGTGSEENAYCCENTSDKVFLLNYKEVTEYLVYSVDRQTYGSAYSKCQGVYSSKDYGGNCDWWLRSPFSDNGAYSCYVYVDGIVGTYGLVGTTSIGVRPALYVEFVELP